MSENEFTPPDESLDANPEVMELLPIERVAAPFAEWFRAVSGGDDVARRAALSEVLRLSPIKKLKSLQSKFEAADDPYKRMGEILKESGITVLQAGYIAFQYSIADRMTAQLLSHWLTVDGGRFHLATGLVMYGMLKQVDSLSAAILDDSLPLEEAFGDFKDANVPWRKALLQARSIGAYYVPHLVMKFDDVTSSARARFDRH